VLDPCRLRDEVGRRENKGDLDAAPEFVGLREALRELSKDKDPVERADADGCTEPEIDAQALTKEERDCAWTLLAEALSLPTALEADVAELLGDELERVEVVLILVALAVGDEEAGGELEPNANPRGDDEEDILTAGFTVGTSKENVAEALELREE